MIAITQASGIGPGKDYIDKLLARSKTRTETIRLLRRRLSDVVFTALRTDKRTRTATTPDAEDAGSAALPAAA